MNKDFLKEVFGGSKELMSLNDVKYVNVPLYDELAVVKIWPQMRDDAEFMQYFPTKMPKGRLPDRAYFYNIMNTVQGEYL